MEPKLPATLVALGGAFSVLFMGLCFVSHPPWLLAVASLNAVAFLMGLLRHEAHVLPHAPVYYPRLQH